MGGAHVARAYTAPFRIEPEAGQVAENSGEASAGNKARYIFQEHETASKRAMGSPDERPKPSLIIFAALLTGEAPRLAGKAGNDASHAAGKGLELELAGIAAPNRRRLHALLFHPGQHCGRGEGVPLNVGHNVTPLAEVLEAGSHSLIEHGVAAEEREKADGIIHVTPAPRPRGGAR